MDTNKQLTEEQLKFQLPENNQFPVQIFDGLSPQEIGEMISTNFVAMQQRGFKANRLMTDKEIFEIRAEYGDIAEQQLPELQTQLELVTSTYKAKKERLTDEITALKNQFTDLVSVAREGVAVFEPENENTYKIPVAGHYLYYSFTGSAFQLIAVREIPSNERYDLFNTGEKNKEMFEKIGYQIPEFNIENKENYRVIELENNERVEIWEEDGKEQCVKHWVEDHLDCDTDEIVPIELKKREEYAIGENPYENEQIEAQEGTSDEISGNAER